MLAPAVLWRSYSVMIERPAASGPLTLAMRRARVVVTLGEDEEWLQGWIASVAIVE